MGKDNTKLYISMYHYVRDLKNSRYPRIKGMDVCEFREQLDFYKKNFNVVTMEQVLSCINGDEDLPENALLLTFDDGYTDHYLTVFPILMEYGFQGSFFIPGRTFTEHALLDVNKIHFILACTEDDRILVDEIKTELESLRGDYNEELPPFDDLYEKYAVASRFDTAETIFVKRSLQTGLPERIRGIISGKLFKRHVGMPEDVFARELYMNTSQMSVMRKNGMFFGLHGYDHYWLGNLDRADAERDIDRALGVMAPFIDRDSWVMNYPYGSCNEDTIDIIRGKGCKLGLTTEVRAAEVVPEERYRLPRFDCNDFPPRSDRYAS